MAKIKFNLTVLRTKGGNMVKKRVVVYYCNHLDNEAFVWRAQKLAQTKGLVPDSVLLDSFLKITDDFTMIHGSISNIKKGV